LKIKEALNRIFKVIPLTQGVRIRTSYLRIEYGLPKVDFLILATAVSI